MPITLVRKRFLYPQIGKYTFKITELCPVLVTLDPHDRIFTVNEINTEIWYRYRL